MTISADVEIIVGRLAEDLEKLLRLKIGTEARISELVSTAVINIEALAGVNGAKND